MYASDLSAMAADLEEQITPPTNGRPNPLHQNRQLNQEPVPGFVELLAEKGIDIEVRNQKNKFGASVPARSNEPRRWSRDRQYLHHEILVAIGRIFHLASAMAS